MNMRQIVAGRPPAIIRLAVAAAAIPDQGKRQARTRAAVSLAVGLGHPLPADFPILVERISVASDFDPKQTLENHVKI